MFEEFGLRCQKISGAIKDLQIAQKMALPGTNKKSGELLNAWVDFYLDHGMTPPAGFAQVATQSWSRTLSKTGEIIGLLVYEKIAPDQADSACITMDLLAHEKTLEKVATIMTAWSEILKKSAGETITQTSNWLAINLSLLSQLNGAVGNYPGERQNSREFIICFRQQWQFVRSAPPDTAATIYKFTRDELADKLKKEFERWQQLTFR
ncbi:MAG: hypothetical protein PHV05_06550 [Candidatus Riflebacteria bacterium]|nr:hypothetical protein [Candidatus Riflebacteria bacterium]